MAYGITSESQLIDVGTINSGCDQVIAAAEKFVLCANSIQNASNGCTTKALSVDNTTMQPQLTADAEYIKNLKEYVESQMEGLKGAAAQIYAAQLAELQAYLEEQRRLEEAKKNNNNN